jgi:predicted nucleic acid-binding protein
MSKVLIDTNLLLYLHDANEPAKQDQARRVLGHLQTTGGGCLSVQSLAEFINVATRKMQIPIADALREVELFARIWPVFDLTASIVFEAGRGVREHRLSYYDAQLWAAARLNQAPTIFSEDFASGSYLEGVRFVNPFAAEFRLAAWAG